MKLVEEFQELVPDSLSFNVGYFEGQSCKDLVSCERMTMYKKYPKGEITLWCDGRRDEEDVSTSRKRRKETAKVHRISEAHHVLKDRLLEYLWVDSCVLELRTSFLQQLYDDGILTTTEFGEQKEKILCSLKK